MFNRTSIAVAGAVLVALTGRCLAWPREQDLPDLKDYDWRKAAADQKDLTPPELALLDKNKLLVSGETFKQVFTPYIESNLPLFVTSDSLLNAFHVLFEESVFRMEEANADKLPGYLKHIWGGLAGIDKGAAGDARAAAARRRARIVVAVALGLLGEPPTDLDKDAAAVVDAEVKRVAEAKDKALPAWLGKPKGDLLALDYSRYRPRGFYTRSERLERYFRAISWLQSIPFRLSNDEELTAILMLGSTVGDQQKPPPPGLREFFNCYSKFIGCGDDWDLMKAASLASLGPRPGQVGLADWALKVCRQEWEREVERFRAGPQINDQVRLPTGDAKAAADPNFRILSAYRIPDAVLFHRTINSPEVWQQRMNQMPTGLEIAAALCSDFAAGRVGQILDGKVLKIVRENAGLFRGYDIYRKYLHCLAALLDKPEPDAPAFMASAAWQIKSCQTALGGWAQMRHTWILQAKLTANCGGDSITPAGFVEPEPEFFARMGSLAKECEEEFKIAGAFDFSKSAAVAELRQAARLLRESPEKDKWGIFDRVDLANRLLHSFDSRRLDWSKQTLREMAVQLERLADDLEKGKLAWTAAQVEAVRAGGLNLDSLWQLFRELCGRLEALAHKQLRGRPMNDLDKSLVLEYGSHIAGIMLYGGNSYLTPRDDAPRVADVVNNPNTGKYLLVGVARPRAIYVLYPWQGKEILCRGAVLPYCEFAHPARLTDAEWKTMLDSKDRPAGPDWLGPIFAPGAASRPETPKD